MHSELFKSARSYMWWEASSVGFKNPIHHEHITSRWHHRTYQNDNDVHGFSLARMQLFCHSRVAGQPTSSYDSIGEVIIWFAKWLLAEGCRSRTSSRQKNLSTPREPVAAAHWRDRWKRSHSFQRQFCHSPETPKNPKSCIEKYFRTERLIRSEKISAARQRISHLR